ncbi:hypothetical protein K7I13_12175 [Brucepastera parasyntrophica]|uniref:hypothetical protein n=1 Tax=Brucepastera parasyntrophica TaxID=2880008 RepID=UPI00210DDEEB|nr:hypothetical protein [Brucepastera parasyntrophica]ULQ59242.1 hypothetical protein K7I13_12175 [Brucepastera parasyntrophica]
MATGLQEIFIAGQMYATGIENNYLMIRRSINNILAVVLNTNAAGTAFSYFYINDFFTGNKIAIDILIDWDNAVIKVYRDAELIYTNTSAGIVYPSLANSYLIGVRLFASPTYLKGTLDNAYIFSYLGTDLQIEALYRAEEIPKNYNEYNWQLDAENELNAIAIRTPKYLFTGYATANDSPIVTVITDGVITQATANINDYYLCSATTGAGHTIGTLYEWTGSAWEETRDTNKVMASAVDALALAHNNPDTEIQVANVYLGQYYVFQKSVASAIRAVPKAGDLLISMGLNPRDPYDLNYQFLIMELATKTAAIESWITHFKTERIQDAFNVIASGAMYASRGFYAGNVYKWEELLSNPGSDPAEPITGLNPYSYIETGSMLIIFNTGTTAQAHFTNDGVYFNPLTRNGSALTVFDIAYGNGIIVIALPSGGTLRISQDEGGTWSEVLGLPASVFIDKVTHAAGRFICLPTATSGSNLVGYADENNVLSWSQDGDNGGASAAKFLCGGNSIFLAFATNGRIWICTDGKNFTYLKTIDKVIFSVNFYDGKFLIACGGDGCFYTTNGSDLVDVTPQAGLTYRFFSGNDGVYCATTSNSATVSGIVFTTDILAKNQWEYAFDLLDFNRNVVGNTMDRDIYCVARSRLFKKTIAFLSGQPTVGYDYIIYEAKYQDISNYSGEWLKFDMTIEGETTNPTKGTVSEDNARKKLVGKELSLAYNYKQTGAGSAGSGDYLLKLPDGLKIDIRICPINSLVGVGLLSTTSNEIGANTRIAHVRVYTNQYLKITYNIGDSSSGAMYNWGSGRYQLSTANITMRMQATLTVI